MKHRVIFIAGQGHIGSTLLDLFLSTHPSCVGLGELTNLLHEYDLWKARIPDLHCSCGSLILKCSFWQSLLPALEESANAPVQQRYSLLLEYFRNYFGPDKILIDSSKHRKDIAYWSAIQDVDLRVVHLVRDVRSWTISRIDALKREKVLTFRNAFRKHRLRVYRPYLYRSAIMLFLLWYVSAKRTEQLLHASMIPYFTLGYEEFACAPEKMGRELCEFLDIDWQPSMLTLRSRQTHMALGNRMKDNPQKRHRIVYDVKWLSRREWLLPSACLPWVMGQNTRLVYSNSWRTV